MNQANSIRTQFQVNHRRMARTWINNGPTWIIYVGICGPVLTDEPIDAPVIHKGAEFMSENEAADVVAKFYGIEA